MANISNLVGKLPDPREYSDLISVTQAAEIIGCSGASVHGWIRCGLVQATKGYDCYYIKKETAELIKRLKDRFGVRGWIHAYTAGLTGLEDKPLMPPPDVTIGQPKIAHISLKQPTVEGILRQLLNDVESIESVVIVARCKDSTIETAWSESTPAERAFLSLALQGELMDQMKLPPK